MKAESICHHCPAILVHELDRIGEEIECPNCHNATTLLGEVKLKDPDPELDASIAAYAKQPVRCPACSSIQIAAGTKGFRLGKAAIGRILLGEVGLLGGLIGSKEVQLSCMRCGEIFEPQGGQ